MIDCNKIHLRKSFCLVRFRDIPTGNLHGAVYIENEYHKKMNRYLSRWGWWLQRKVFHTYEGGYTDLTYLPSISNKIRRRANIQYYIPYLPKKLLRGIPELKTTDVLRYLEDPDDARFMNPGFLFYKETEDNGISIYEYYPLAGLDNKVLSYKTQISEILEAHRENAERYRDKGGSRGIGHAGLYCSRYEQDEDYADNMFESLDFQTRGKVQSFAKQVRELQDCGVPLALLERILHQDEKLSKLVITRKNEIVLPDYNNMKVKLEPLVKAVFFLFLKHPEGIVFKFLPDYREELINIYKNLKPLGLNERSLQSIEDVTNPCLNSINEKCARIRAAFVNKFDEHLAKNYYITGNRGDVKKIVLPRDLVVWE